MINVLGFGGKQYLEEIILESFFDNPFDGIINNPEIDKNSCNVDISDIYFKNNYLCTNGTLRWDETDDEGTSYCSVDFKAGFTYEYDETIADLISIQKI